MILDHYLLPLIEISISIVIPLILTLKTLQITNQIQTNNNGDGDGDDGDDDVVINEKYSRHILTYWMTYWFLFCFIQSIGSNNHFRLCFSIFYMVQYKSISPYLVEFYQESLIPQISKFLLKIVNLRLSEVEVDYYATYLLENICFNDHFIHKILSLLKIGKEINIDRSSVNTNNWSLPKKLTLKSNRKPSKPLNLLNGSNTNINSQSNIVSSLNNNSSIGTPENIIPLEIQKPRTVKHHGGENSISGSIAKPKIKKSDDSINDSEQRKHKKKSNDNLRAKSSSTSLNGTFNNTSFHNNGANTTSRKSSKTKLNTRNVSNEDNERENIPSSLDSRFYSLDGSQIPDDGANLLIHGYNGDPFSKSNNSNSRLKNFFNSN